VLSKTAIHALTAVARLAELPAGEYAGAVDIARKTGAPQNYLGKLLKTLADNGLLVSQKGRGGGFRLARDPAQISLREVVEPIEHLSRREGCFMGQERCADDAPCPVHERWQRVRNAYADFLQNTSVADLSASPSASAPV